MLILSERFKRSKTSCISWKHRKHIFSLDEVEQGFFLDRFQVKNIGKTTIPKQIVLHQERLARIRYHRPPFSLFEVSSSQKNRFLGLLGNIPEFLLDHYHSERSGTKFEHQSETEFKICTHGSEVRNCRDQRWPEGFFSRSSRSRLRRSIFAANDRKKTSGTQGSLTDEIFRILPVFSQFLWNLTFLYSGSPW